jgi:hypothetical protein
MAKDGRVLRTITTPSAKSGDGGTFAPRPVDLSFSPDGSKIAYSYVANSCPVASSCGVGQRSTFYTRADASPDATPISTWGNQFSVSDPEWITNDKALVFGGATHMVNIDTLDSGEDYNYVHWFDGTEDTGDGELSRDGTRLATTFSYGSNLRIEFFAVHGDARTSIPDAKYSCAFNAPDPNFGDPSWSPDSKSVAFQDSDGIETIGFATMDDGVDYGGTGCTSTGPSKVIVPGGTQPDWGPADPAPARYLPPANGNGNGNNNNGNTTNNSGTTTTPPKTTTPRGPKGGGTTTARLTLGGAATQRFTRSIALTCTAPTATTCKATIKVKAGARTYTSKTATARATASKPATLKVTFSPAATKAIKKAIKRSHRVKAVATVTAGTAKASRTITLKR